MGLFLIATGLMAMGAMVQASVGFGQNLVVVPIFRLIEPDLVPGPTLMATMLIGVLVLLREGTAEFGDVKWALGGRVPGTILGVIALSAFTEWGLSLFIAIIVLLAVVMSVAGVSVVRTSGRLVGAGIAGGFAATTSGIGGPPLALLYQRAEGPAIRGALGMYSVFGATLAVAGLAFTGELGRDGMIDGLLLLPGVLVGFLLSHWAIPVLDRGYTRPAVLIVCSTASIVLLATLFF